METTSGRELVDVPVLNRFSLQQAWSNYLGDCDGDAYYPPARAADLSGLPPALIMVAEVDPLRNDGLPYAARLSAARLSADRLSTEAIQVPGAVHGFDLMFAHTEIGERALAPRSARCAMPCVLGPADDSIAHRWRVEDPFAPARSPARDRRRQRAPSTGRDRCAASSVRRSTCRPSGLAGSDQQVGAGGVRLRSRWLERWLLSGPRRQSSSPVDRGAHLATASTYGTDSPWMDDGGARTSRTARRLPAGHVPTPIGPAPLAPRQPTQLVHLPRLDPGSPLG